MTPDPETRTAIACLFALRRLTEASQAVLSVLEVIRYRGPERDMLRLALEEAETAQTGQ